MSNDKPNYSLIPVENLKIAVVCASFNEVLTDALLSRVCQCLEANGKLSELLIERVPGSHELPSCIDLILQSKSFDCVIGLGVVIKGNTSHHHLVADTTGHALQKLSTSLHIPIINGVIVTEDRETAVERITGSIDRGLEFAQAALQMANLRRKWTKI